MQIDAPMDDNGWEQIRAGVSLIQWSRLATWERSKCVLRASSEARFESLVIRRHRQFGRVISWITFAAGTEYFLKGARIVKGLKTATSTQKRILRPPAPSEDVLQWVTMAADGNALVFEDVTPSLPLGKRPISKVLNGLPNPSRALMALDMFTQSIRNRDAHRYCQNVRPAHFHVIPQLLVPTLNDVLSLLDTAEVRARLGDVR